MDCWLDFQAIVVQLSTPDTRSMSILRQKVVLSRRLWLTVTMIMMGLLSTCILYQKGGDTVRVYNIWLDVFRPSTYEGFADAGFADVATAVARALAGFVLLTLIVFCISAFVGWLAAAVYGSCALLFHKR